MAMVMTKAALGGAVGGLLTCLHGLDDVGGGPHVEGAGLGWDQDHVGDAHRVGTDVADARWSVDDHPVVSVRKPSHLVDQRFLTGAHDGQLGGSTGVEVSPVAGAALGIGVEEQDVVLFG